MEDVSKDIPQICVPITGVSEAEIMEQLTIVMTVQPDIIEWRADFFEGLDDTVRVDKVLTEIAKQTNVPLLFTIRSEKEGGQAIPLSEGEVVELLIHLSKHTALTYIDYEMANAKHAIEQVQKACARHEKIFILSYHNFTETPDSDILVEKAKQAEMYGASVVKLAVMPQTREDVTRLLHVTSQIDALLDIPVITMSMGELGAITRVVSWVHGSAITFAVGVEASAPGQIAAQPLREAIEATKAVTTW